MEQQEVKATGAMPGLESLVNSIKGLRFKVVKLSTYNSLENQLKLKDQIIVINQTNIKALESENESLLHDKKALRQRVELLHSTNESLERQIITKDETIAMVKGYNDTQSETIKKINLERLEALNEVSNLMFKIKRKDQPRKGGKFASKKR